MGLLLAFKAFMKALKNPTAAKTFVETPEKVALPDLKKEQAVDLSHLRLLALLQRNGRLIDFLQEDIEQFDDAQVGAAAREIHRACRECLEEMVALRPVVDDREGAEIRIPKGYDASRYKVIGKVVGEPPYVGILVHRGWQARKQSLPKQSGVDTGEIVSPAEIELR